MNWLVRFAGAVCIIAAASGYGWGQAKELYERYRELSYLTGILSAFRSEVSYQRSSLGEIFLKLSDKSKEPYRSVFQRVYCGMEKERRSFGTVWENAVAEIENLTCLKGEDIDYMRELTEVTKALDEKYMDEIFAKAQKEMAEQKELLEREYLQKGKIYCCLGITIGIMGVIILI